MSDFLKKPNSVSEYTPELIQELCRCKTDPIYFIRNYVYIQHPTRGKVKFDLFPYQEDMISNLHTNRFNILKVGRQQGKCYDSKTTINIRKNPNSWIKKTILRILQ